MIYEKKIRKGKMAWDTQKINYQFERPKSKYTIIPLNINGLCTLIKMQGFRLC